jgi:hypothetical protein
VKYYLIILRGVGEFDSTGIRPSSLLKWLNSLYRPAVPEGIRGAGSLRRFSGPSVGASPSGKAVDFDSTMRRFESSRPSQAFRVSENFLLWMRKARKTRAFLIANSLWRLMFELLGPRIPKSLQPNPTKLPFSGDSPWRPENKSTAW